MPRGSSRSRGFDSSQAGIGTVLLLELPRLAAADKFWNEEPFARNGGYQRDARIVRWVFGD
jgi:hypothetical protein